MFEILKRSERNAKTKASSDEIPATREQVRVPQMVLHFDKLSTLEFTTRFPVDGNDPDIAFKDFLDWFQRESGSSFFMRHSDGGTLLVRSTIRMCEIRWVQTTVDTKEWEQYKAAKQDKAEQGAKDVS